MPERPKTYKPLNNGKSTIKVKSYNKHNEERRGSRHERGYTNQWYRLRAWYIAANPLCAYCLASGTITPAKDVDHIVPISQGADPLDIDNLQSLCRACHNKKTHGSK